MKELAMCYCSLDHNGSFSEAFFNLYEYINATFIY